MSDDFELKFEMGAYAARSVYSLAKENHELLAQLDAARADVERLRADLWTLAHEIQTWRTSEGQHSTSCQEGDGRGCWACKAFESLKDVRTKTDESGALQRAIDDEAEYAAEAAKEKP